MQTSRISNSISALTRNTFTIGADVWKGINEKENEKETFEIIASLLVNDSKLF